MMARSGLSMALIEKIMQCVTLVSFFFLLNGTICGNLKPSRGLRQGDHLSPYLFLVCADGLSSLLNKAVFDKRISCFKCNRTNPTISHLFFADDSLLLLKASSDDCLAICNILDVYAKASSQLCVSKDAGGIGFRDLAVFNRALLAKQCWRLVTNMCSFGARVLMSCYFPTSSFLEVNHGASESFIWRSFLWGRDILLAGSKWRIRDGRSVSVYNDR
ncbi:hypothetical protein Dsin_003225 [Dipteronia sinensis]|uniref:Reverse transcriptase domain-containing protein n=1 Tax=Dipteronia sinensis TaxID=43782 RepID=A0AAE0B8K4_9ROSI|nr:hypothetical protein Dsin_003225 [Dipteronia sinensis]